MRLTLTALLTSLTLASCSSLLVEEDEYMGFLPDYTKLEVTESPSGAPVRRWIDPAVDLAGFDSILLHPVVFYPAQKPTDTMSQDTLDSIKALFDKTLGNELSGARTLVTAPGARTLEIKPAITSVTSDAQGLAAYEFIPIALIIAGVSSATGSRDRDTLLNVEIVASDAATGRPVALAVRQLQGEELPNAGTMLTSEKFAEAFSAAAADARALLTRPPRLR